MVPLKLPRAIVLCALALVAATGIVLLASRYPVPLPFLVGLLLTYVVLLWFRPEAWLLVLPASLPVVDLAPWTGWVLIDEQDLILATTLAVGYLRTVTRPVAARLSRVASLLFGLLAMSYTISAIRGFTPAQAFDANALSSYLTPYNALRIAKGFFWAWLLIPLLARTIGKRGENLHRYFFPGVFVGLAGVCLVAVWERHAFPGLTDFSSDYRTTASFSAMHTGGAALDGFLALTMPFAAVLLLPGRRLTANLLGLALWAVGTYVLLTTFSRALYVGYALSLLILLLVYVRSGLTSAAQHHPKAAWRLWALAPFIALLTFLLYRVFRSGGYRVLAAGIIFLAAAVYVGGRVGPGKVRLWWLGGLAGLIGSSLLAAYFIPKGPYVVFAVAGLFVLALGLLDFFQRGQGGNSMAAWLSLGFFWLSATVLLVANHWGGSAAVTDATVLLVLGVSLVLANRHTDQALWRLDKRTAMLAVGTGVGLALLIPVAGNYYSQERFSQVGQDLATRRTHWQDVLAVMDHDALTPIFGMGLGRFPAEYFWRNSQAPMPGSFQYLAETGNHFLRLAGPRYPAAFGEVLRFGQRVSVSPQRRYRFAAAYRTTAKQAILDIYLCERLLLYHRACRGKAVALTEADGGWHEMSLDIDSGPIGEGKVWRPAQISFANPQERTVVDLDNLRFGDAVGTELIKNGDFERGNDFWFYSSDRYHLPWHAKNLWLSIYFDQGWFGVLAFSGLLVYVLARLAAPTLAGQPIPGLFLAAIAAFLAVGLFDSLLDVPRIGTLFYLFLLVALYLTVVPGITLGSIGREALGLMPDRLPYNGALPEGGYRRWSMRH